MGSEEMKELIKTTIQEVNLWNTIVVTLLPVVITLVVNVFLDFKRRKKEFIKKYKIEQLQKLYLPLYSMIAQSEYVREITKLSYEEAPYIELSKKIRTIETMGTGGYKKEIVEIDNGLADFNELAFVNLVIDNSQYASQLLIKLAVSYRFLIINRNITNEEYKDKIKNDYDLIVTKYINTIVIETNEHLKYCGMNYNKNEIKGSYLDFNVNNI